MQSLEWMLQKIERELGRSAKRGHKPHVLGSASWPHTEKLDARVQVLIAATFILRRFAGDCQLSFLPVGQTTTFS
jgi:hypothetical protein